MPDSKDKLLADFSEFLASKSGNREAKETDDYVEIWDDKGRGARVRKCDAAGWLKETFDIDVDDGKPGETGDETDDEPQFTSQRRSVGRQSKYRPQATEVEDE